MQVLYAVGVCVLLLGCSSDRTSPSSLASAAEVVAALDCDSETELDGMLAPIRGGAATTGVACETGGVEVHVFERARVTAADESLEPCTTVQAEAATGTTECFNPLPAARGGTIERITDIVGLGQVGPSECAMWILVSDTWFVLADEEGLLQDLQRDVGGASQEVAPAAPPHSYPGPGCPVPN